MNLLEGMAKRTEKEYSWEKEFNPYLELNRIGVPIEKRREIVENVYSFLGKITLKPSIFKTTINKIRENKLYGEGAIKQLKQSLNIPYV